MDYNESNNCKILFDRKIQTADVTDREGNIKGKRGFIYFGLFDFSKIKKEEFVQFLDSLFENNEFCWFTIICDQGEGLQILNRNRLKYGKIDSKGVVTEVYRCIIRSDDGTLSNYEYFL